MDNYGDIKKMIATMMNLEAQEKGYDTFEEANDFEVEDDFDFEPFSPYEIVDMPEPEPELAPDLSGDDSGQDLPEDSTINEQEERLHEQKERLNEQEERLKELRAMGITQHELSVLRKDLEG